MTCALDIGSAGMAIPSAMGWPGALREQSPVFPRQDIATTIVSSTATRKVFVICRMIRIAVIERQLFPLADISEGNQPERAGRLGDVTVVITGVVAVARGILEHRAIDIIAVIEDKDIAIPLR